MLVTGGRGVLAREILSALSRSMERSIRLMGGASAPWLARVGGEHVRVVGGDATRTGDVAAAAEGARVVVQIGYLSFLRDPENPALYLDAVEAAVRGAARAGVARVIYISSLLALGPNEEGDHDTLHDAIHFHGPIERIAWDALGVGTRLARELGIDLLTLFPTFVFGRGPAGPENPIGALAAVLSSGRLKVRVGTAGRRITVCHAGDVAGAVVRAVDRPPPGDRLTLGGHVVTTDELLERIAGVGGWSPPRLRLGCSTAGLLARLRRRNPHLRLLNHELIEALRHDWVYSSDEARRALDYRPRPLAEGLEESFAHRNEIDRS